VKTVSATEFFEAPGVVKVLTPGQKLAVTENGATAFTVIKAGARPRRSRTELETRSRKVYSKVGKADVVKTVRNLR